MSKELTAAELKTVELDILKYLRDLCERMNLKYYLMGGTLLGAVRHQGFIPWDDDIDVMMPRKDYDQLIAYFRDHPKGRYQLADYALQKDYSFPIGKLMDTDTVLVSNTVRTCKNAGAFIDIFPLDRVKDIEDVRTRGEQLSRYNTFIHVFSRMLPEDYKAEKKKWSFKEALVYRKNRVMGLQRLIRKYDQICRAYNDQETKYSAYIGWILHDREIWSDELLGEGTEILFEGEAFNAPSDYKSFLEIVYGDYMQLPPEDKRVTRHSFKVYWRDR